MATSDPRDAPRTMSEHTRMAAGGMPRLACSSAPGNRVALAERTRAQRNRRRYKLRAFFLAARCGPPPGLAQNDRALQPVEHSIPSEEGDDITLDTSGPETKKELENGQDLMPDYSGDDWEIEAQEGERNKEEAQELEVKGAAAAAVIYDHLVDAVQGYMKAHKEGVAIERVAPGALAQACWVPLEWLQDEAELDDETFNEAIDQWEHEKVMKVRECAAFRVLPERLRGAPHRSAGPPPD